MKNPNFKLQSVLFLLAVFLFACNKEPQNQPAVTKSAAKNITTFKFSGLTPQVTGTITEASKTITVIVPNGTQLKGLVPSIQISEKAAVTPLSGAAQNFTNPVKYTVTAENGSTQEYMVTVMIDPAVSFTINPHIGSTQLQQDNIFSVYGTNFGSDYTKNKIVLINKTDGSPVELPALSLSSAESILIKLPQDLPVGQYNAQVFIGIQSKIMPETFTVIMHTPQITNLNKSTLVRGENIIIGGNYFQASGNILSLQKGGSSVALQIINESATSIEAKIPDSTTPDSYTLRIKSNQLEAFYGTLITVTLAATDPKIVSINNLSFARGATMIITGKNLQKAGSAPNINFIPFFGGTTLVRTGVANAEGTQVSYQIPQDFTVGTYIIAIEVDGKYSEEYNDTIQITP